MWSRLAIPGHSFVGRMAILNKLPTKDRMLQWGLAVDRMCVFCRYSTEDRDHLFFQCSITKRIWDNIMGLCLVSDAKTYWKELVNWGTTQPKGRVFRTLQCKLAWWATVYRLFIKKNVKGRMRVISSTVIQCSIRVAFCRWEINYALPPIPCLEVDFG